MTIDRSRILATALCTVAVAVSLVACDRPTQAPGATWQTDPKVAQMEREHKAAKVEAEGNDTKPAAGESVDAMANSVGDVAITTRVNAELVRDSQLRSLRVDVDTLDGRVTLRGDAPNASVRDRATALAQRVDGVKSVDNQINIKANS